MRRTLLITGATGFVGSHLAALAAADWDVHTVARRPTKAAAGRHHIADLSSPAQRRNLLTIVKPTHLIHLAWFVEPAQYWTSIENDVWFRASAELFREFADAGGERIVGVGTSAEYVWNGELLCEGVTPEQPASPYGASKLETFRVTQELSEAFPISAAWARLFMVYGPGEPPSRFIPTMIRTLLTGGTAVCQPAGARRDFIHVHDVAAALLQLAAGGICGAVNVGSGCGTALREVVAILATRLGNGHRVEYRGNDDSSAVVADVSRLRDEADFQPAFDLVTGLDDTIAWWRQFLPRAQ
jgi:UDP-glucuronate decarboxylase